MLPLCYKGDSFFVYVYHMLNDLPRILFKKKKKQTHVTELKLEYLSKSAVTIH